MTYGATEFNAATVEKAVEKAAAGLEIEAENLSYEVLDAGSGGFMGIGARDARILVSGLDDGESPPAQETEEKPSEDHPIHPTPQVSEEEPSPEHDPVPEEVLVAVRDFMDRVVIEGMGLDARLDVYDAGDFVAVDVATDQTGLFIGQKGETIDAVEYLAGIATFKHRDFWKRLVVDSEGYRQRRIEAVQGIAHRTARRALREKRAIQLPPMNAPERRVVHLYLEEDERVNTFSEGEGENRRVNISPL